MISAAASTPARGTSISHAQRFNVTAGTLPIATFCDGLLHASGMHPRPEQYRLNISDLIVELTALEQTHGNLPVRVGRGPQSSAPIKRVDGHFARRGTSFVLIDTECGQVP